jgi:hypothetical protein
MAVTAFVGLRASVQSISGLVERDRAVLYPYPLARVAHAPPPAVGYGALFIRFCPSSMYIGFGISH